MLNHMASKSELQVQRVTEPKQLRDFFALRRRIYRGDPAMVFPLKKMERIQLDEERNPFYQHARRAAFVCYRDAKPVGRIVAIKDDLHNKHNDDQVGFFGFFESEDEQAIADSLFSSASQWLVAEGCTSMRGPVNPSMKSDFGVLIDGHQYPPKIMMGHTPGRYDRHLMEAGFEVAKNFYAFRFNWDKDFVAPEHWKDIVESKKKIHERYPSLRFTSVKEANYAETLRDINRLGNEVRSEGWGFVPLTDAELDFMIKNLRQVIRFDNIHAAYWKETDENGAESDRLVGYIVNIPDVNWALQQTIGKWDWLRMIQMPRLMKRSPKARVIALGVDKNFRKKGVAMLLIQKFIEGYKEYLEWEFSWVLEDNVKSIRAINRAVELDRYKTYRLYEKPIS